LLQVSKESWKMCRGRYKWLIGDGNSSVHHAVQLEVLPYGHDVKEVECANHVMKCLHNRMVSLCNNHPQYRGRYGLLQTRVKQITHGAQCVIQMHGGTGDINALLRDVRNGIRHYFGDHQQCSFNFCKQSAT